MDTFSIDECWTFSRTMKIYKGCRYLILMALLVFVWGETSINGNPEITVHIKNELPDNEPLTLHCQSKDDDLGEHTLAVNEEQSWSFRTNFGETTLFYCDMHWARGHGHFDIFEAFFPMMKACKFRTCSWFIRGDGLYFYNLEDDKYMKIYEWKK